MSDEERGTAGSSKLAVRCAAGRTFAFDPAATALLVIDMQRDFCAPGGYAAATGADVGLLRAIVPHVRRVLDWARERAMHVVHTREGHRPDLSDCPAPKRLRSRAAGAEIGSPGPMGRLLVRGERGHDFIDELAPRPGETVLDKPGYSAFHATDLQHLLYTWGVTHLIVTGVTTDVCVHSTLRAAVDLGYECLLLSDCTAAMDPHLHEAAVKMVLGEGGIFGAVATSEALLHLVPSPGVPGEGARVPRAGGA